MSNEVALILGRTVGEIILVIGPYAMWATIAIVGVFVLIWIAGIIGVLRNPNP